MTAPWLSKFFIVILFACTTMAAAAQTVALPNAFSHNDYRRKRPLLDALNHGFQYVEADIYLRKEKLVVAHILPGLKMKRTLESLYLQPLLEYVQRKENTGNKNTCPLTLMIDIKSDADATYRALLALLEKYKPILSRYNGNGMVPGKVTIVLSGHKPSTLISGADSGYVFMDDNLRQITDHNCTDLYPMASCKYSRLLKWKGKGAIPLKETLRLEFYVAKAHELGRKVRLWASPENKAVWNELLKYDVDLINTNRLSSLQKFLTGNSTAIVAALGGRKP